MPANMENSAVAIGLEKFSFHSNGKNRQCHRMFKITYNCANFTCWQGNAQNTSNYISGVCELRASRYTSRFRKGRSIRDQIANTHWIIEKAREFQKKKI